MSDNVIRPKQWLENGAGSMEAPPIPPPSGEVEPGGSGPHDPGMELRVAALELDMKDVKGSLGRLEVSAARVEAALAGVATKADVATQTERVAALQGRMAAVETAITDTVKSAVGKAIGPWQLPGVLAACGAVVVAILAGLGWLVHQPWFLR